MDDSLARSSPLNNSGDKTFLCGRRGCVPPPVRAAVITSAKLTAAAHAVIRFVETVNVVG